MVTYYNKKDLVSFGNYLGSEKRRQRFINHPEISEVNLDKRLAIVHDTDIGQWIKSLKK